MPINTLPRPVVTAPGPWAPPMPDRFTLSNGVRVCALHMPGQAVATVHVHLGIDLHTEPAGCDGIATIMTNCLHLGAGSQPYEEFTAALAEFAIDWSTDVDHTGPSVVCRMPSSRLDAALELIAEALAVPHLDPTDVSAACEVHTADLAHFDVDAPTRAERELPALIFDPATRDGRPADGTPDTVSAITPGMVTEFHRVRLCSDRLTLVIAGDLTGIDVPTLAEACIGNWSTSSRRDSHTHPHMPTIREPVALLISQPGTPQTHLTFAAPTISRHHPDWPALATALHILGAPAVGRLDAHLRQAEGHTYGVTASLPALTAASGQARISASVAGNHTVNAANDLLNLLHDAAHHDEFTKSECERAKSALLGTLPLTYEHAELAAEALTDQLTHDLPSDFYTETLTRIRYLTPDDITHAYRTHLQLNELRLAAIGIPEALDDLEHEMSLPTIRL